MTEILKTIKLIMTAAAIVRFNHGKCKCNSFYLQHDLNLRSLSELYQVN